MVVMAKLNADHKVSLYLLLLLVTVYRRLFLFIDQQRLNFLLAIQPIRFDGLKSIYFFNNQFIL